MWFARAVFLAGAAAVSVRAGDDGDSPAASVHVLSDSVFESVVGDGSFWLVEFYAPWCGHCKKLNPILDTIAPEAHAKHGLRIGKLDAPKHKKVADRFGVKSFPTLKYHMPCEPGVDAVADVDTWKSYNGGRDAEALLRFAGRMMSPPIAAVANADDAAALLGGDTTVGGVAFVCASAAGTADDAADAEPGCAGVYEAAALAMQADATFGRVATAGKTRVDSSVWAALGGDVGQPSPALPFVAKVEKGELPRLYPPFDAAAPESAETNATAALTAWLKANNAPLVSRLGPSNFRKLGSLPGKLLCVALLDLENDELSAVAATRALSAAARDLAATDAATRDKFVFGLLDGVKWATFVKGFNVYGGPWPRIIVMDMPAKLFYEDESVNEAGEIATFLRDVVAGEVPAQSEGADGLFGRAQAWFETLGDEAKALMVVGVVGIVVCIFSLLCMGDPDDGSDRKTR